MGILSKALTSGSPKSSVFYFFETVSNSVFITMTGIFFTIFLSVLSFALMFFDYSSNQVVLFSLFGVIFFSVSYSFFLKKNGHVLSNLTYENFLLASSKLCGWVIWTFNFYLLFCWFMLILIGSTNGFGIQFPTSDSKPAFMADGGQKTTKILGYVLLCVHLFLLVLMKVIIYYWDKIFMFAAQEFTKSSSVLEGVSAQANLEK